MQKGIDHIGITTVFACHDGEGNYLFSKRSTNCRDEHGTWDPGGGGLDFGDMLEDNVRKEVMEEYCATVLEISI
jgi:8-oxo-dGTP pyrophosphatase MutT (NUDIX family)